MARKIIYSQEIFGLETANQIENPRMQSLYQ